MCVYNTLPGGTVLCVFITHYLEGLSYVCLSSVCNASSCHDTTCGYIIIIIHTIKGTVSVNISHLFTSVMHQLLL